MNRVEELKPLDSKSRIIDASAGSGIFLVGSYRRLLERNAPDAGWSPAFVGIAQNLLRDCIFGLEKHLQAVNVCRFSLYLTMLDYVGRAHIDVLVEAAGSEKFFPDLSKNIRPINAFSAEFFDEKFTHVVGNPPWSAIAGQKDRYNQNKEKQTADSETLTFSASLSPKDMPVAHHRLSDLFVWLAKERLAEEGGVIALILPTKSLVGRQSGRFAHAVGQQLTVNWVSNFSHLRRKLFPGAEAPACLVVATNRRPIGTDRAFVYRPLISSLPAGKRKEIWSLLAGQSELESMRAVDFQSGENGWFCQIMLSRLDRRMNDALKTWSIHKKSTFGDFLGRSGLLISKGGSEAETGVKRPETSARHPLSENELLKVQPKFRGKFAGNVLLVPRSMLEATYSRSPVAYSSSFNAIYSVAQSTAFEKNGRATIDYMSEDTVSGLLGYLNSSVLRYFASLFGATYLMDKTRFEKNDLLSLPCPFVDIDEASFKELGRSENVDEEILNALKAGKEFRDAFYEFSSFRKGYANSQIPLTTMIPPEKLHKEQYTKRLLEELTAFFRPGRKIQVTCREISDHRSDVFIEFYDNQNLIPETLFASSPDVADQFLSNSIVTLNREKGFASIAKPSVRYAWTIDQAVLDAMALSREIRRSAQYA